jgi:GH15 family glucan-1,4-alpha-glucosidase
MMKRSSLSDYALIGNCRSAALVSKYGSIEWCCLPEFHSPAIFCALLDKDKGGYFSISPIGQYESFQRYLPDTNVLETHFNTSKGEAKLTDTFVAVTEEEKKLTLFPDHEILRVVQVTLGVIRFRMEFSPTVFYARYTPQLKNHQKLGIKFSFKENSYVLLSTLEEIKIIDNKAICEFDLREGEGAIFSFSCSSQSPAILPELAITGWQRIERTKEYWKNWMAKCTYKGLYQEQVKRSVLILKLLAHAPSGAIIAAPTTSLPESLGGERNWDYRYCWLRDASFTVRVLMQLGYKEEADAYMNWILHATRLTRPKLQVVYSVYGISRLKEKRLSWLNGYHNSRPVRIGNGAHQQFQLDVYGEVLDAVFEYSKQNKEFDRDSQKFIIGLGNTICKLWNQPDNGIWEVRSTPGHHTHSKVMAWVGLDRLIQLSKKYGWKKVPLSKYEQIKQDIEREVEQSGFNAELQSYCRELGGRSLDASVLVFPLVGYCDASSPKMFSTIQCIKKQLTTNNLVYRYHAESDELPGQEGAFGICSFWLAESLAKLGKLNEAKEVFETMLAHASHTGLLSEEIDPASHEMLGNYPQGFTHIGLISAALSIQQATVRGGKAI